MPPAPSEFEYSRNANGELRCGEREKENSPMPIAVRGAPPGRGPPAAAQRAATPSGAIVPRNRLRLTGYTDTRFVMLSPFALLRAPSSLVILSEAKNPFHSTLRVSS